MFAWRRAYHAYLRVVRGCVNVRVGWISSLRPAWVGRARGRGGCRGSGAVRPAPAAADTLKWALTQAYQNNPQLNAQRAAVRATDESVPQALSGYRPRVSLTRQRRRAVSGHRTPRHRQQPARTYSQHVRHHRHPELRRHGHADAVQRLPHRQPHAAGGATGVGGARDAAADRADRAAQRRHRLHEPDARHRDPRSAAPQRRGAAGAAAADPRPLQCRRGDAHRRGAGGIAARRRARRRC